MRIKFPCQSLKVTITTALALVTLTNCLMRVQAQPFSGVLAMYFVPPPPPDRGTPSGRPRGGASRGNCPSLSKSLTALVPATQKTLGEEQARSALTTYKSVWGLTVAEHPTLWFYVPYSLTPRLPIKFVLQDERGNYVYKTSFTATETQPGIVKFHLPSTIAPLEVGKMYHWYFLIDCDPDTPVSVDGWIQRVPMNSTFTSKSQKATPLQRVALYADNGIWYDALTTLAELRIANPSDAKLINDWVSLLNSVGLDAITHEPINQCCNSEKRAVQSQFPTSTKGAQ